VSTGLCVKRANECQHGDIDNHHGKTAGNGSFFSTKCQSNRPLLCSTGECVSSYQECLPPTTSAGASAAAAPTGGGEAHIHLEYEAMREAALKAPRGFEFTSEPVLAAALKATKRRLKKSDKTCKVVCQDGSCRDRQASCPPIWACPSSQLL